tara:strand:+ start:14 stop:367 length:354 start_codon:yes stop_codon:yes gene_type:complete
MPWLSKNYIAAKRAFKKRLGLFDKDVVIEEYEEQAQTEDEFSSWLEGLDEQHEIELEESYAAYEETEMERQHEEAEIERQIEQEQEQEQYRIEKRWEDFSIAEIEKEYKQKNKGNKL